MVKNKTIKKLLTVMASLMMVTSSCTVAFADWGTGNGDGRFSGGYGDKHTNYIVKTINPSLSKPWRAGYNNQAGNYTYYSDTLGTIGRRPQAWYMYHDWGGTKNRPAGFKPTCYGSHFAYTPVAESARGLEGDYYADGGWGNRYFYVPTVNALVEGYRLGKVDPNGNALKTYMKSYKGPFSKNSANRWDRNPYKDAIYYVCSKGTGVPPGGGDEYYESGVVISERLVVTPIRPKGYKDLSPEQKKYWNETHHKQVIGPKDTKYGLAYKEFLRTKSQNSLKQIYEGGLNSKSNEASKMSLILDEKNKEGLARGGAFTITQEVKTMEVEKHYEWVSTPYDCSWTDKKGVVHYSTCHRDVWTFIDYRVLWVSDYQPYYSWQVLNARCNDSEVRKLAKKTNSKVVSSNDIATMITTPVKEKAGIQHAYDKVPMDLFLSTKCKIPCDSKPINSSVSDAVNNIQDGGKQADVNKFGGQIDGNTSDSFQIFRDNIAKDIRLDVWYPRVDGATSGNNLNIHAVKTLFSFDKNGTPDTKEFEVKATDGREVIPKGQFKNNLYRAMDGEVNNTTWKADWASSSPHRVNVNYAYEPKPGVGIYSTVVGGKNGSILTSRPTLLNVYCPARMNTKTQVDGTVSNNPKPDSYDKVINFSDGENLFMTVKFVKASAENGTSE